MIRNQYIVTKKVYIAWLKENLREKEYIIKLIKYGIVFAVCVWQFLVSDFYFKILYFILALYIIYLAFFRPFVCAHNRYRWMVKQWGADTWVLTIDFYDKEFVYAERNFTCKYRYEDIQRVKVCDDRINIYVKDGNCIRIYNICFAQGNREELLNRFVSAGML